MRLSCTYFPTRRCYAQTSQAIYHTQTGRFQLKTLCITDTDREIEWFRSNSLRSRLGPSFRFFSSRFIHWLYKLTLKRSIRTPQRKGDATVTDTGITRESDSPPGHTTSSVPARPFSFFASFPIPHKIPLKFRIADSFFGKVDIQFVRL